MGPGFSEGVSRSAQTAPTPTTMTMSVIQPLGTLQKKLIVLYSAAEVPSAQHIPLLSRGPHDQD